MLLWRSRRRRRRRRWILMSLLKESGESWRSEVDFFMVVILRLS